MIYNQDEKLQSFWHESKLCHDSAIHQIANPTLLGLGDILCQQSIVECLLINFPQHNGLTNLPFDVGTLYQVGLGHYQMTIMSQKGQEKEYRQFFSYGILHPCHSKQYNQVLRLGIRNRKVSLIKKIEGDKTYASIVYRIWTQTELYQKLKKSEIVKAI